VWRGTGQGLSAWQQQAGASAPFEFKLILLDPPRDGLRAAIAARFDAMIASGAVEEVRDLLALGLDPALPAMRAYGVPELGAYLRGELSMGEARDRAVAATGRYVKRQSTWFRNRQIADQTRMRIINARFGGFEQLSASECAEISAFVSEPG
jgi:tRNA dimethylallyltransferase